MSIGENIKKLRKENGLTQKQLGEKCGMADSAIRRYELGKANPKIETLLKIATALNVSIIDLDTRSDFTTSHLERELQNLRKKELTELKTIPNEEWFGDKWNEINQKYTKQRSIIQKKLNDLYEEQNKHKEANVLLTNSGTRIKHIREEKGMTRQTLAVLADIPISLLCKYEAQKRTPSYEHIFRIAKILGVPTIDISFFQGENISSTLEEDTRYKTLIDTYNLLNKKGQQKILDQIEMISRIPEYIEQEP